MAEFKDLPADHIRLTDVSRTLRIDYQRLFRAVTSGVVPFKRIGNGKGFYATHADNLSVIAHYFGVPFGGGQAAA